MSVRQRANAKFDEQLSPMQPNDTFSKVRAIAYYLPQFHPIPENDEAWGIGFTEWTNVTKALPLFKDHHQPQLPADLGFYDLRLPEVREAQAELAREHGIEGFCYWHYWFAGKRLLERPFEEVLESGKPNFPFCLGWANETWSGLWSGGDDRRIIREQTYPGQEDQRLHFEYLLKAFRDPRYIRVDGKPLLLIYKPLKVPNGKVMLDYWRGLAAKADLPGLQIVASLEYDDRGWDAQANGYDAITVWPLRRLILEEKSCLFSSRLKLFLRHKNLQQFIPLVNKLWQEPEQVFNYGEVIEKLVLEDDFKSVYYPVAIPNWDTTARYAQKALILHDSSPTAFKRHLHKVFLQISNRLPQQRIVFLKSWNEWAEGNFLEPSRKHGRDYLKAVKEELDHFGAAKK